MATPSPTPPRAPPVQYYAPNGTRWAKEKAAAGGSDAFEYPTDPKNIGPWIIGECIGKGASGRVKIAKHKHTGQLAAVKILPLAPLINSRASLATKQAKTEKQRLGIDREITMMKLMNHPNIMRIYDVYEGSKELFLVLEYVEGGELFDFLVNRGRLPPLEALAFFKQVIYGLNYAHTFSIIHRDLKPENILIASLSPPLIKIADWGMAAFAPPSLQLETSCGSPHYASPEIVNGEKYQGNATDIWSCGVILFALLTGRLPFDDKNVRNLLAKVKIGKYETPAWVDPVAKDLLTRMLVVDVEKRISIPEILNHPWLRSTAHALSPTLSPPPGLVEAPPLPPSPSTLAAPIPDESLIDPELFASLRIIWGRHADKEGEGIKRDLCAPVGQGVHAKAFYFLLEKYREETARLSGNQGSDCFSLTGLGHKNFDIESMNFNLGWELNPESLGAGIPPPKVYESEIVSPSSRVHVTSASHAQVSPLPVPHLVRDGSLSGSKERPTSPAGPRSPPESWTARKPDIVTETRPVSLYRPLPSNAPRRSLESQMRGPSARMSASNTTAAHRPPAPRRGYTFSHPQPEVDGQVGQAASAVEFPKLPPTHQARRTTSMRPTKRLDRPSSSSGIPARHVKPKRATDSPVASLALAHARQSTMPAIPGLTHAPKTDTAVPKELDITSVLNIGQMHTGPPPSAIGKAAGIELQSRMDEITGKVNDVLIGNQTKVGGISGGGGGRANRVTSTVQQHQQSTPSKGHGDKENESFQEEGWSYVNTEDGRSPAAGGNVLAVARDVGNVAMPPEHGKGKKDKGVKHRPPPLEFSVLNKKRSMVMLTSPTLASPPPIHGSSSRATQSPVVGEFKGWFSNLFGWKSTSNTQPPAGTGVLYAPDSVPRTLAEVRRFMRSLGVSIEEEKAGDAGELSSLRCRVDESASGALGGGTSHGIALLGNSKSVRFRVQFSSASQQTLGGPRAPASNPTSPNPAAMGGEVTAIVLVHEKGSSSTFKAVWKKLKDVYEAASSGNSASYYPCFSPTVGPTPTVEQPMRFAM